MMWLLMREPSGSLKLSSINVRYFVSIIYTWINLLIVIDPNIEHDPLPDDPESNTRSPDIDREEKVLVTPADLRTEQLCLVFLVSMTELEQSTFLKTWLVAQFFSPSIFT